MATEIIIRYVHFISLILLLAAVLGQHLLLKRTMSRGEIAVVQRLDVVYAIMVGLVLLTGFAQWFWVAKPAQFYSSNPVFHVKITLFLIVGVISAYPSIFFGKQRKGDASEAVQIPKSLLWSVRAELLLLFLMPLLANLMARGIGVPLVSE